LVVNTRKGKEELYGSQQPMPVQVDELYQCTAERMKALGLPGLRIENRLFVNGRELRGLPWLLPDPERRPISWVDPGAVDHFQQLPSEQVRHYQMAQLVEWDGELVLSIFLRFCLTGGNLFCEASYFLLAPISERYHAIDDFNGAPDVRTVGNLLMSSIFLAPVRLVCAPFVILNWPLQMWACRQQRGTNRRLARQIPTFDHGATTTLRQQAMSPNYRHYFQMLDKEMYHKLVEQQIFDSLITYLDTKGIDTSDLKERQTTVLNNGVIVSGGSVNANNLAVGSRSHAGKAPQASK
jgi:hypothetical protein